MIYNGRFVLRCPKDGGYLAESVACCIPRTREVRMLTKLLTVAALALVPAFAFAAPITVTGIGPRVGFSVDPDQIVIGGHAVIGEIVTNLTFDPSFEIGFGDDLSVISLNFDMHYHFEIRDTEWRPYAGAGIGIHFIEADLPPPFQDDSNTEVGGSLILGAGVPTQAGNRFFGEAKFGLGDVPEIKMVVGWNFRI
jgi:hypothetical protein